MALTPVCVFLFEQMRQQLYFVNETLYLLMNHCDEKKSCNRQRSRAAFIINFNAKNCADYNRVKRDI